jgi:hypothetical protein
MPDLSTDKDGVKRAGDALAELWSAATTLAGTLADKLPKGAADGTPIDPTVEATFRKMLDPGSWLTGASEMDAALSRLTEGPRFADLWDVERRNARVFQAWLLLRRRSLEHAAITMEAWLRAGRRFSEEAAKAQDKTDGRALLTLWTDIANRELIDTQRSEAFLRTQAAMIRASTALKTVQRELAEYYGDQFGMPTRTELDDVHRTVTELRRELRALQRQQQKPDPAPAPEPPPVPTARTSKPPRARKSGS